MPPRAPAQHAVAVISIGAMPANDLWGEREPVRTGHATTTLVCAGNRVILTDPGLPPQAVAARLGERAGIEPGAVTDVFLTSFGPDTARGVTAFPDAAWWIDPTERETVGVGLAQAAARAQHEDDQGLVRQLSPLLAALQRCKGLEAPLVQGVDPFPLYGVTPGCCGLLVAQGDRAALVCGDAIPTADHAQRRVAPKRCHDAKAAKAAFGEALEIADTLVPGRDNLFVPQDRDEHNPLGPWGAG